MLGVHPGAMSTGLARRGSLIARVITTDVFPAIAPLVVRICLNGFLRTPTKFAGDLMRAAFNTEITGKKPENIYLNGINPVPTSKESTQKEKGALIWSDSISYAAVFEGETVLKSWK